jgi:2-dehydro-3-deoxyphosphogluconate aldolase / (4S)-4-hydroxy-2-oxoglutarate aldolase
VASPEAVMRLSPVIPVLTIEDAAYARAIAEALVAGGLKALEVTLRTPAALEAIAEMAKVEGAVVGAGTVLNAVDLDRAVSAGARFIVSPGLTEQVVEAAQASDVPILPGVATAGDLMRGFELGLTFFKFFPAEAAGGRKALASLAAPFHRAKFCPTGGITLATAPEWLGMDSVLCVGGSWLVPAGPPDIAAIQARAADAAALAR